MSKSKSYNTQRHVHVFPLNPGRTFTTNQKCWVCACVCLFLRIVQNSYLTLKENLEHGNHSDSLRQGKRPLPHHLLYFFPINFNQFESSSILGKSKYFVLLLLPHPFQLAPHTFQMELDYDQDYTFLLLNVKRNLHFSYLIKVGFRETILSNCVSFKSFSGGVKSPRFLSSPSQS